nr:hypothetical protein [Pandoravirus massiliensis]
MPMATMTVLKSNARGHVDVSAWTARWFRVLTLSVIAAALIGRAAAEAPPHGGCSVRTFSDSCVDACCVWCPASPANATAADQGKGETAPLGSCHDRGEAPCGAAGISRPALECYVELGVALAILAGVLASGAGLCYARRWWVRRRAARLAAATARPSARSRSSSERAVTMVDIPYAELEGGRLAYYASPYALVGDVERAPTSDEDGDKVDRYRAGKCQTQ